MAVTLPPSAATNDINLLFEGDSLTVGFNAGGPGYPSQLMNLRPRLYPVSFRNLATNGHTLTQMTAEQATTDLQYNAARAMNIMVLWGGTNDMADAVVSGSTCEGRLNTYCSARRTTGWKVVVLTCMPRSAGGESAGFETARNDYNTLIRANWTSYADALVDVAANDALGVSGCEANTVLFADRLHLTTAGHSIVAPMVRAGIASLNPPLIQRAENIWEITG